MVTSSTPLHVRHVNLAKGFRGGERQTVLLIRALAAHGIGQSLVCRHDSPLPEALADVDVAILHADHQLAGHFRGARADLVHAHEAKAVHWAYLHRRLRGTPYLLTRRVPQPVRNKPFNRLTYRSAACAVAISRIIEQHLDALAWCPIARIPSALSHLPSDSQQVEALRQRFAGRRVVGHIGALVDRHKGQRLLIDAARQLRESHPELLFVCLGQGEDEAALKQESADLDNLVWEGFRSNVGDYLEAMALFAFPSRNEGLGSILLDVMDHDVPIVAADVDGIPDIVVDDRSGVLVPANDAGALARAIVDLLDDPERCLRLTTGARQRLEGFTPAAMAERYLSLYRRLLVPDEA
ncbi:glycosyltransferase family 4 protein [Halomonas sp. McH1-25]|uniref:glycosyltransferase family 4 protein n=1 Tax=unclassified Halomonas TaxID=2609666 RepID=UPI001EF5F298|nr:MULTISPECIES: glycosyltransferase family 4 protein [unclassified Halomonas]MCG7599612.1 glycosyltransferase family 4 protein [Halomonas sp. McH1-25]MCP1342532.1 glycosyltransferase family 4 protein [Halomonas sp. FL8]MCP1362916.1 glycosyltransferase family 4 protein [Halomonas sp. BBD45]